MVTVEFCEVEVWRYISEPFTTRSKNHHQEKNILQEIQLTVPEAEQKSILADVEKLANEGTQ